MNVRESDVRAALAAVPYPGFTRDIVSFGLVKSVAVAADGSVTVRIDLGTGDRSVAEPLRERIRAAVSGVDGVTAVHVRVVGGPADDGLGMVGAGAPRVASPAAAGGVEPGLVPGARHVVAVASGKGGVGKSTVAVNLAVALARAGFRVGLLDADVYGPSIPLMMGEDRQPEFDPVRRMARPFERYGVRFMSLGFLAPREEAVIWRGPMVMKAIEELLRNVDWGDLDVLIVDMPPGTGDAQLTLSQKVRLAGAVVVTTPQDVALADAIKGIAMFRKVGVPILGLVENMSFFACPHCGERTEVFGHGGGRRQADRLDVPFLAEIPLDAAIRDGGDVGRPVAAAESADDPRASAFGALAASVARALDLTASAPTPSPDPTPGGMWARLKKGLGGASDR